MSRYRVAVARRAVKTIRQLPRSDQQRIRAAIDLLADEPRPNGCIALSGEDAVYLVRVGAYRILYEVLDDRLVVHIIRVGHRREVYRPR
ncbi:type II toxin-antitoxin system RelE family toxin [Candidatus Poriferisodalis sp.]|uniref:type II toxin-antitoxin system RelE family toxin n=1 Tax=Candidatus Poriferisodalis sp. TaxID=3101277 RepID=UPI003B517E04